MRNMLYPQKNKSVDGDMGVDDLIFHNAKKYPQKMAYESAEVKVNYGQLDSLSCSFAHFYLSRHVKPCEVIALSIKNDFIYLIAILGAMKIGATLFSIPVSEPAASRLEEVTQLKISKYFSDFRKEDDFEWIKIPSELSSIHGNDFKVQNLAKIDMAWMALSSSGSTGVRKVFTLTHRQQRVRNLLNNNTNLLDADDRISAMSPLCYPAIKQRYLEALSIGATIIKLRGLDKVNALAEYRVSVLFATSMHAEQLLEELNGNNHKLQKLRDLYIGGSEVKDSLRKRIISEIGCNLVVRYACNETSLISSTSRDDLATPLSVGTPAEGVQIKIINSDGAECNAGVDGLILVKTAGMITSYLNEDDTSRNFRDGWFITGDVGNLNSQRLLTHKGRRDGVVIFNGINISLAEITKAALSFDFVADVASISLPDPIHQDVPICMVQFDESSNSMLEHFKEEMRDKLGSRGPKAVFQVDKIPRNLNGKVIINDLRDLLGKLMIK